MQRTIARSDTAVIVLVELRAFAEGCLLELDTVCRIHQAPGDEAQQRFRSPLVDTFREAVPDEELPEELLRIGVRFTDGRKITALSPVPIPGSQPQPPVLNIHSGQGWHIDQELMNLKQPLWLWPLPPPEPFDLVVEWPAFGLPLTHATLDGASIAEAAERAVPYWPTPLNKPSVTRGQGR